MGNNASTPGNKESTTGQQQSPNQTNPTEVDSEPNVFVYLLDSINRREQKGISPPNFGGPKIDHATALRAAGRDRDKASAEAQRERDKLAAAAQHADQEEKYLQTQKAHEENIKRLERESDARIKAREADAARTPQAVLPRPLFASPTRGRGGFASPARGARGNDVSTLIVKGRHAISMLQTIITGNSLPDAASAVLKAGRRGESPRRPQASHPSEPADDENRTDPANKKDETDWLTTAICGIVVTGIMSAVEIQLHTPDNFNLGTPANLVRGVVYAPLGYFAYKTHHHSQYVAGKTREVFTATGSIVKFMLLMLVIMIIVFSVVNRTETFDVAVTSVDSAVSSAKAWLFPPETEADRVARKAREIERKRKEQEDRETKDRDTHKGPDPKGPKNQDDQNCAALYRNVTTLGHISKFVLELDSVKFGGAASRLAFYTLCAATDKNAQEYIQSAVKCACMANDKRGLGEVKNYASRKMPMRDLFRAFGPTRLKEIFERPIGTDATVRGVEVHVELGGKDITFKVPFGDIRLLQLVDFLQTYDSMPDTVVSREHKIALTAFVKLSKRLNVPQTEAVGIAAELMRPMAVCKQGAKMDENEYKKIVGRMLDGDTVSSYHTFDAQTSAAFTAIQKYFETEKEAYTHTQKVVDALIGDFEKYRVGETLVAFGKSHTRKKHRTEEEENAHKRKKERRKNRESQGR